MGRMIDFFGFFYYFFQLVNVNGHICDSDRKVGRLSFDEAPEFVRCVSHFNVVRACGVHGVVVGSWGEGEREINDATDLKGELLERVITS